MTNLLGIIRGKLTNNVIQISAAQDWLPAVGTPDATAAYDAATRQRLQDKLAEAERLVNEVRIELFQLQV